jgi:renalase
MDKADVLVVGAGIAGLMAAHTLSEHGLQVTVVDKGRSVGGRLATRRVGAGLADHGVQFFTVRTPVFRAWVDRWLAEDLVYEWTTGFSDGSIGTEGFDGHPRYAVHGGMNALAKQMAASLKDRVRIDTDIKLTSISLNSDIWEAQAENGAVYTSRGLLLTPPVPQSLALLKAGKVHLMMGDKSALERIVYAPCVAGLFRIDGTVDLPEPGALQRPDEAISWIADNHRKGISPDEKVITVHAGSEYSRQLWEMSEPEALALLHLSLEAFLAPGSSIVEGQLKRWQYALPTSLYPERYLLATNMPPLAFAGDAFGTTRVEGAALSGLAAGAVLAEKFKSSEN